MSEIEDAILRLGEAMEPHWIDVDSAIDIVLSEAPQSTPNPEPQT